MNYINSLGKQEIGKDWTGYGKVEEEGDNEVALWEVGVDECLFAVDVVELRFTPVTTWISSTCRKSGTRNLTISSLCLMEVEAEVDASADLISEGIDAASHLV